MSARFGYFAGSYTIVVSLHRLSVFIFKLITLLASCSYDFVPPLFQLEWALDLRKFQMANVIACTIWILRRFIHECTFIAPTTVQICIRMLRIPFEWFKFHSNSSNPVRMIRICIQILIIPFEWFKFAFEFF